MKPFVIEKCLIDFSGDLSMEKNQHEEDEEEAGRERLSETNAPWFDVLQCFLLFMISRFQ